MSAISEITICNKALSLVGIDSGIASLDANHKNARLCKLLYPIARNNVLTRLDWRCAGARASLARLAAVPAFGWAYQYQLPTSPRCLKIRWIDGDLGPSKTPYEPEGDKVLTNSESLRIKYTFEMSDPTKMTPELVEAIATQLGIDLVVPLCSDKSRDQQLTQKLEMVILPLAMANNQAEIFSPEDDGQVLWAQSGR